MRSSPRSTTGLKHTQLSLNSILSYYLFISSLVWSALSADPPSDDCEPKDCGNGLNISYPFWIDGQQPRYCGYPAFKLACMDHAPVISIYDDDYLVRDIFYENQSFITSRVDLLNSSCPVPRYNLSLRATPFSVSPTNRNLSFFLSCGGIVPGYSHRIDCAVDGNGRQYFVGYYPSPDQENATENCDAFVVWPSKEDGSAEGDQNYTVLLENGFLLNWDAVNCIVCKASGGRCRYNITESRFSCVCSDRSHAVSCNGSGPYESHPYGMSNLC